MRHIGREKMPASFPIDEDPDEKKILKKEAKLIRKKEGISRDQSKREAEKRSQEKKDFPNKMKEVEKNRNIIKGEKGGGVRAKFLERLGASTSSLNEFVNSQAKQAGKENFRNTILLVETKDKKEEGGDQSRKFAIYSDGSQRNDAEREANISVYDLTNKEIDNLEHGGFTDGSKIDTILDFGAVEVATDQSKLGIDKDWPEGNEQVESLARGTEMLKAAADACDSKKIENQETKILDTIVVKKEEE